MPVRLSAMPSPHPERVIDFSALDGGLNLRDRSELLSTDESPDMENLLYQDGLLRGRPGQDLLITVTDEGGNPLPGVACYEELFHGCALLHMGTKLLSAEPAGEETETETLYTGLGTVAGTFFRGGEAVYYKAPGVFLKVTPGSSGGLQAEEITQQPYVPVILINADPTTCAGDLYETENRLSPKKTVHYNAASGVREYRLPVKDSALTVTAVTVDGAARTDWTLNAAAGTVTFTTAPPVHTPPENNTVSITYSLPNPGAADPIMSCRFGAVVGAGQDLCLVLGGSSQAPGTFFWSGSGRFGPDWTYWPTESYNLASDSGDPITGLCLQYGSLIVLQEHAVGKAAVSIDTVEDLSRVNLIYTGINTQVGCDLPGSARLVRNNLVFASKRSGVWRLRETSAGMENALDHISGKIDGSDRRPGLLAALRREDSVGACDDGERYWLRAGSTVYAWDYERSSYTEPAWYPLTDIAGEAFFRNSAGVLHEIDSSGRISRFMGYRDFGEGIPKRYAFPTRSFGGYDRLKDVLRCIFTLGGETKTTAQVEYLTDYERRPDRTPLRKGVNWTLVPRDLSFRDLSVTAFPASFRRRPCTRHLHHFAMTLTAAEPGEDLAIESAQVYYRYLGRDR